jgi:hypothetical protein
VHQITSVQSDDWLPIASEFAEAVQALLILIDKSPEV